MKRVLIILFFTIFLYFPQFAHAHPIDTSQTRLFINTDIEGKAIPNNQIKGEAIYNWLQLSALTKENANPVDIFKKVITYEDTFTEYLTKHFSVNNNGDDCNVTLKRVSNEINDIIVNGIKYNVFATCKDTLKDLKVENSAFKEIVVTQNNSVWLFDGEKELVPQSDMGFRQQLGDKYFVKEKKKTSSLTSLLSGLKDLVNIESTASVAAIFLTVFAIGGLHALEGGHNKMILGSLIINKKVELKQAFIYTVIFTLTHISDIIILSIGLLVFSRYVDLYTMLPNLQIITLGALVILSMYWLFKEIRHIVEHKLGHEHHHEHEHEEEHPHEEFNFKSKDFKSQILMAFVSGLAPCITGWSIFMLLFSSGRVNLMLPGIIFFGLGVFTVLSIYTLIIVKTKDAILNKFSWIGEWATVISAGLVFLTALIQLLIIIIP